MASSVLAIGMGVKQIDMFGPGPCEPRAAYTPPPFAPYPDALLRRLTAMLRLLQSAEIMPWPAPEAKSRVQLFLGSVERLPADRRGTLAEAFKAELARLG